MRHIAPCCSEGWIDVEDHPERQLTTEHGDLELLGIAYRHPDDHLTVVPFDDPYLGALGRQTLLLLHQHIVSEFERMKNAPPEPPRKHADARLGDPVPPPPKAADPSAFDDAHVRVMFWEDSTGYHEAYEIGKHTRLFSRRDMEEMVKGGFVVARLTMNGFDQGDDNRMMFIQILLGKQIPQGIENMFGKGFRPSQN